MTYYRKHFFLVICTQIAMGVLALIDTILHGVSTWLWATFVMWFLMYVVGEGIFLHRHFAHKSFETYSWLAKIFAVFGSLGGFGGPIGYRAAHVGVHHAHSDQPGDCHSPVQNGFWYAAVTWHLHNHKLPMMICKSLLRDKFYVWLENHVIMVWWSAFVLLAVIDPWLAVYGLGLAGMIGFIFAGWTNAVGHTFGSQRFKNKDNSRNQAFWSWICWQGSGALQNNHHAHPGRFHDSWAWYEFDIGKWIIPLIATRINQR
jgi:stearoyl-CoA desaturase (delta-9 desaturase)